MQGRMCACLASLLPCCALASLLASPLWPRCRRHFSVGYPAAIAVSVSSSLVVVARSSPLDPSTPCASVPLRSRRIVAIGSSSWGDKTHHCCPDRKTTGGASPLEINHPLYSCRAALSSHCLLFLSPCLPLPFSLLQIPQWPRPPSLALHVRTATLDRSPTTLLHRM